MHTMDISCTVNRPDGTEFYYEAHRWTGIDDDGLKMLSDELHDMDAKIKAEHEKKKEDSENLSAVLKCSVDGQAWPDVTVTGVSYHSLVKMEREWHKAGDRVIKEGERRAINKK